MEIQKALDVTRLVQEFAREYNVPVVTLIQTKTKKTISPTRGVSKKKMQEIFIFGKNDEEKKFIAMRELQKRLDGKAPGEFMVRLIRANGRKQGWRKLDSRRSR